MNSCNKLLFVIFGDGGARLIYLSSLALSSKNIYYYVMLKILQCFIDD